MRAWDELAPLAQAAAADLVAEAVRLGRWPQPWQLAQAQRLQVVLRSAQEALGKLGDLAGVTVTDGAGTVIHATSEAEPPLIASQLPAAEQPAAIARFASRILPGPLSVIVARTQAQIVSQTRPLSLDAMEGMRRALVAGVAVGSSPADAAADMVARVEGAFNGGLTRAMTIARTEILDAYRTASGYAHNANADVLSGWRWLSSTDGRTCPACWSKNGTMYPLSAPGPWGHPSCRCTRVPLVKDWEALGIHGVKPPAPVFPDAQAAFARLPHADQLAIMGPARLDLLHSGRISWDQLAVRRDATGWRPSYVARPVRDLQRLAGQPSAAAPQPAAAPALPRRTPAKAAPPAPTAGAGAARPLAGDLFANLTDADAAKVYDGTFAGLRTKVTNTGMDSGMAFISGRIYDPAGTEVGSFGRVLIRDPNGKLVAYHGLLKLDDAMQGQGFAQAFNNHLIDWYRESGVDRIELIANINIGGYAWARDGYDFADEAGALKVLARFKTEFEAAEENVDFLREEIADEGQTPERLAELARREAELVTARDILDDADRYPFGDLRFPSAYRISQAGRWPGAGRDDMWIGKAAMLGSEWDAVKPL